MNKKTTTVLLVSNDRDETKSFNIPTIHIKRFRYYFVSFVSLIVFTIALISYLFLNINSSANEKEQLLKKISSMENDVKLIDSLNIKTKIDNIENNINFLNNYLKERGVKPGEKDNNIGGELDTNRRYDLSLYEFYNNYTALLLATASNLPLGYPFIGEVRSDYGYRSNPFGGGGSEFHKGIDLKGNIGDTVRCTGEGIVEKTEWDKGYGKCITIKHTHGLECIYGHLSEFNVTAGQKVKAGDVIGFIGSTGRSTGPHLHYEIRINGIDINPHGFLTLN
jgi:murein DD-endopeptidase MepM/ murein hydrolase activator NlpD